ncbi:MAG: hypothetical protein IT287_04505, partial [Bdellovibrionaceae bacterium]|nr:hypothetical protein [Pseudobdellovibrionaceae bacterium]
MYAKWKLPVLALSSYYLAACTQSGGSSAQEQSALAARAFATVPFNQHNVVDGVSSNKDSIPSSNPYHAANLLEAV